MCCAKDHREDYKRRHETMYQPNPTEMFRERQLALLREAEDRRHAGRLRAAASKRSSRSERRKAGFRRAMASLLH
jgi:hypothetical protein